MHQEVGGVVYARIMNYQSELWGRPNDRVKPVFAECFGLSYATACADFPRHIQRFGDDEVVKRRIAIASQKQENRPSGSRQMHN